MRRVLILIFALPLAVAYAHTAVCAAPGNVVARHWTVAHYVYDASLKQDWEVLIDCDHPAAPARLKLALNTSDRPQSAKRFPSSPVKTAAPIIKAGSTVEVSGAPGSSAAIQLSGTALETAFAGQPIRVRLSTGNRLVTGLVRGPHSVELAAAATPRWSEQ